MMCFVSFKWVLYLCCVVIVQLVELLEDGVGIYIMVFGVELVFCLRNIWSDWWGCVFQCIVYVEM